jgi:hypothetical protein
MGTMQKGHENTYFGSVEQHGIGSFTVFKYMFTDLHNPHCKAEMTEKK